MQLVLAQQRDVQALERLPVEHLSLQAVGDGGEVVHGGAVQARAVILAAAADHVLHARLLLIEHAVAAVLDDAGLGLGDFLDGIAQHLHVIQADVHDHRGLRRVDDVGGVQLAAQAHLQHYDLAGVAGEVLHCDAGDQLKLGGVLLHGFRQRLNVLGDCGELLVGDLLTAHLHALVEAQDVGRGVQAGAVARLPQHALQHGGGGALAVGSGDVDELQLLLRVAHLLQQLAGAAQARTHAHPADAVNVLQRFIDVQCGYPLSIYA